MPDMSQRKKKVPLNPTFYDGGTKKMHDRAGRKDLIDPDMQAPMAQAAGRQPATARHPHAGGGKKARGREDEGWRIVENLPVPHPQKKPRTNKVASSTTLLARIASFDMSWIGYPEHGVRVCFRCHIPELQEKLAAESMGWVETKTRTSTTRPPPLPWPLPAVTADRPRHMQPTG